MYKRFGEITIRVEDFMLRRTGQDRSVPGSEVPVERGQDFFDPDSQISSTDSPIERPRTAPAFGRPPHEARIENYVSIETYAESRKFSIFIFYLIKRNYFYLFKNSLI